MTVCARAVLRPRWCTASVEDDQDDERSQQTRRHRYDVIAMTSLASHVFSGSAEAGLSEFDDRAMHSVRASVVHLCRLLAD